MKRRHLSVFTAIAALLVIAQSTSATYHPGLGRYMQRDPHGLQAATSSADGRPLAAVQAAGVRKFIPRDRINTKLQYADGMHLYQYVRSNPVQYHDPRGLYAGITVHQAPVESRDDGDKDVGHEWIEIKGGTSYGFYPAGSIWGSDGVIYSPDPHAGERAGVTNWETEKKFKYMYDPELASGIFGEYTKRKRAGCCKDKTAEDVKACIKKWADHVDQHYNYSLHNFNCRSFVRLALHSCCLRKQWD